MTSTTAKVGGAFAALIVAAGLAGCTSKADTVSANLSKDADSFKIEREIVFYNGITGEYVADVTGRCSIGNSDPAGELSYTCEVGKDTYIKNFLGLSDNVTWFALQVAPYPEDPYHYKVIFKPEEIIPNIDVQTSGGDQ